MGLRNTTISTACTLYIVTPDWDSCDSGFDDGGAALQKITPAYSYGTQVTKNDSVIGLYDTEDGYISLMGILFILCLYHILWI